MTVDVSIQVSLGRFPLAVAEDATLHQVKNQLRTTVPQLLQVNVKAFRFVTNRGEYLTDDSKTVAQVGIASGDVLHLVKKNVSPAAAVDSEKPADE
jgi:uncharacterized ubiquitin-like protein YukD